MENRKTSTKKENKTYRRERNSIETSQGGAMLHTVSSEVLVLETSLIETEVSVKGNATASDNESLKGKSKDGIGTRISSQKSSVGVMPGPTNPITGKAKHEENSSQFNQCGDSSGMVHVPPNPTTDKSKDEANSRQFNGCRDSCGLMHEPPNPVTDDTKGVTHSSQYNQCGDSCGVVHARRNLKLTHESNSSPFNQCHDGSGDRCRSGIVKDVSSHFTVDEAINETKRSHLNQNHNGVYSSERISSSSTVPKKIDVGQHEHQAIEAKTIHCALCRPGKPEEFLSCTCFIKNPVFVLEDRRAGGTDGYLDQMSLYNEDKCKFSPLEDISAASCEVQTTDMDDYINSIDGTNYLSYGIQSESKQAESFPDELDLRRVEKTILNEMEIRNHRGGKINPLPVARRPMVQKVEGTQGRSVNEVLKTSQLPIEPYRGGEETPFPFHDDEVNPKGLVRELVYYFENLYSQSKTSKFDKDNYLAQSRPLGMRSFEGKHDLYMKTSYIDPFISSFSERNSRNGSAVISHLDNTRMKARSHDSSNYSKDSTKINDCGSSNSLKGPTNVHGISSVIKMGSNRANATGTPKNDEPLKTRFRVLPSPGGENDITFIDTALKSDAFSNSEKASLTAPFETQVQKQPDATLQAKMEAKSTNMKHHESASKSKFAGNSEKLKGLQPEKAVTSSYKSSSRCIYSILLSKPNASLFWRRCACVIGFLSILLSSSAFLNVFDY